MATPGIRDPHRRLASYFLAIPEDQISVEQRRQVKEVVFDILAKALEEGKDVNSLASEFEARTNVGVDFTPETLSEINGLLEMLQFGISKTHGWLSEAGAHMPLGIYDHFKGGIYMADRIQTCTSNNELEVSYFSCVSGRWFGRHCWEWNEVVKWPDGKYRSRFVYRGPDLSIPEPSFKVPTPTLE